MTVDVRHEDGSTEALTIVGEDEAEPGTGRISWFSPLAEALLEAGPATRWPGGGPREGAPGDPGHSMIPRMVEAFLLLVVIDQGLGRNH